MACPTAPAPCPQACGTIVPQGGFTITTAVQCTTIAGGCAAYSTTTRDVVPPCPMIQCVRPAAGANALDSDADSDADKDVDKDVDSESGTADADSDPDARRPKKKQRKKKNKKQTSRKTKQKTKTQTGRKKKSKKNKKAKAKTQTVVKTEIRQVTRTAPPKTATRVVTVTEHKKERPKTATRVVTVTEHKTAKPRTKTRVVTKTQSRVVSVTVVNPPATTQSVVLQTTTQGCQVFVDRVRQCGRC